MGKHLLRAVPLKRAMLVEKLGQNWDVSITVSIRDCQNMNDQIKSFMIQNSRDRGSIPRHPAIIIILTNKKTLVVVIFKI